MVFCINLNHLWKSVLLMKFSVFHRSPFFFRCMKVYIKINAHFFFAKFIFLALPPLLDLEHFLQIISQIILLFHPQPLDAQNSIQWLGTFFLALPPLLDLEHFLQIISQIILLLKKLYLFNISNICYHVTYLIYMEIYFYTYKITMKHYTLRTFS